MQRAALGAGAGSIRYRLAGPPDARDAAFVAAPRTARVLRGRTTDSARARRGIRQALSAIEQGKGRSGCPRRVRAIQECRRPVRHDRHGRHAVHRRVRGRDFARRSARRSRRRRDRRLVRARHRQRRHRTRHRATAEPSDHRHLPGADTASRQRRGAREPVRRLAQRQAAREDQRKDHRDLRRVSLHASRLQRPERARHLARH